jgi:parvulin-like peptidyl-prolyl isomerase
MTMKRLLAGITLALCIPAAAVAPALAQDKIIAVVNNEAISASDLENFMTLTRMQMSSELQGEALEKKIQEMKNDLLERLIEDRLIIQEAKKSKIQADEYRVKAKLNELKRQYASEQEFQSALKDQGLIESDLTERIREQLLMYSIIEEKVRSKVIVKPSEINEYYTRNIKDFMVSEQRDFQSLVVENGEIAKSLSQALKAGKDIVQLAQEQNLKVNTFSAHRQELKIDIEEVLFLMNKGDISDPILINDKFYVFKLVNINAPRQQTIAEVQDRVSSAIYELKLQEALSEWVEGLKKKAYIKMMEEK